MDEPRLEYTVKEIVEHISHKVDKLSDKFDNFADTMGNRVTSLESRAVTKEEFGAASLKARWRAYGLLVTGAGVVGDAILHFLNRR